MEAPRLPRSQSAQTMGTIGTTDPPPPYMNASTSTTLRPQSPVRRSSAPPKRRLAPGLEERLKRLGQRKADEQADERRQQIIGRIPDEQIQELERLQRQQQEKEIARRGKIWAGPPATAMPRSGGVLLTGGPVLTDNEASVFESDASSIIDISDHFDPSETDDDPDERNTLEDTHKYRLPQVGKTRLNILTKEPLSPAEPLPRRDSSTPTTPRTSRSAATSYTPPKMEFPTVWPTGSVENLSDLDPNPRRGLSRSGSIYTLGRASFTGQLSQLTNMRLPEAGTLAKKILSIPTAKEAASALSEAYDQIRMWISKASEALSGLNAEDDVEWAAAGGREGIEDVNGAISRFEQLVNVYISSIERLQKREDVATLPKEELTAVVRQMEIIVMNWSRIKDTLKSIKDQVEIAMDWELLWNSVLGEIAQEMGSLNQMVFEMEERRHEGAESLLSCKDVMNLDELETIVEEQPGKASRLSRLSVQPITPTSPVQPQMSSDIKDGSNLIALFARMEPLRASLDFLPMRLSAWSTRGNAIFPTACQDLDNRREQLEESWKKLSSDADSLRRELGEDKWIQTFRNAGRKALKIYDSISRSFDKLREGLEAGEQYSNSASLMKKIESYDAKKVHYSPAIDRVLAIIDRGVLDRLTVNGEILRLQSELRSRWTSLQAQMRELDGIIEDIAVDCRDKQLRESVSTVVSSERSLGSSFADTPGSSPASSVLGLSRKSSFQGSKTPTNIVNLKTRSSSNNLAASSISRKSLPRLSVSSSHAASPSNYPMPKRTSFWPGRPEPISGEKPRWNTGVKSSDTRDFRPIAAYEPSPYAKPPVTPKATFLKSTTLPASMPPQVPAIRTSNHDGTTPRRSSIPKPTPKTVPARISSQPLSTPTPSRTIDRITTSAIGALSSRTSNNSLRPASRLSGISNGKRMPVVPTDGNEADSESPSHQRRSSSSMGGRKVSNIAPRTMSRMGDRDLGGEGRPKWRP